MFVNNNSIIPSINFTQSAHVASFAVAYQLTQPSGILSSVATLALTGLFSLGIHIAKGYRPAIGALIDLGLHRVEKYRSIDVRKETAVFNRAFEKLKHLNGEALEIFKKDRKLDTPEKELNFFKNSCAEDTAGVCLGKVIQILDHIKESNKPFNSRTLSLIKDEDVLYEQMNQDLKLCICRRMKNSERNLSIIDLEMKVETTRLKLARIKSSESMDDIPETINKLKTDRLERHKALSASLSTSAIYHPTLVRTIKPTDDVSEYRKCMNKEFSKNDFVYGCIKIPGHVLFFQKNQKEYIIFDPREYGGTFKYNDEDTFIEGLRNRILTGLMSSGRKENSMDFCYFYHNVTTL